MLRSVSRFYHAQNQIFGRRFLTVRRDDDIDRTINMLAEDLSRLGIDYAIIGGNALKVHGFYRFTTNVDVLVAKGGKALFADNLVGRGYTPQFRNARGKFMNTIFNTPVDLIEAGDYPGDGKPKTVAFPNPVEISFDVVNSHGNKVKYMELLSLVQLKLAAYQSLPDRRMKDKFDVIELIKAAKLHEELANKLDCSVRKTFLQCYQQALEEEQDNERDN